MLSGGGILGGGNLGSTAANLSGFPGGGGLPHSSLMAYPPPLTNNSGGPHNSSNSVSPEQPGQQHSAANAGLQHR